MVCSIMAYSTMAYSSEAFPPAGIQGVEVAQVAEESPLSEMPQVSPEKEKVRPVKKKSKGRMPREKEAEGTQAPNRFDPDTFIKSRYELNGQSLEVDTE
jgi:hypothetical protein